MRVWGFAAAEGADAAEAAEARDTEVLAGDRQRYPEPWWTAIRPRPGAQRHRPGASSPDQDRPWSWNLPITAFDAAVMAAAS